MSSKRDHVVQLAASLLSTGDQGEKYADVIGDAISLVDEIYNRVPLTEKRAGKANGASEYSEEFEAFWALYPKNGGAKKKAWEAYTKIFAAGFENGFMLVKEIVDGLTAWIQSDLWQEKIALNEMSYIPHAATWLNQRRWEDDLPESKMQRQLSAQVSKFEREQVRAEVDAAKQEADAALLARVETAKALMPSDELAALEERARGLLPSFWAQRNSRALEFKVNQLIEETL